jgi:hypothetical protein
VTFNLEDGTRALTGQEIKKAAGLLARSFAVRTSRDGRHLHSEWSMATEGRLLQPT